MMQQPKRAWEAVKDAGSNMQDRTRSLKETARKTVLFGAVGAVGLFAGTHIAQSSSNAKLAFDNGEVSALTSLAKEDGVKLASDPSGSAQQTKVVYVYGNGPCQHPKKPSHATNVQRSGFSIPAQVPAAFVQPAPFVQPGPRVVYVRTPQNHGGKSITIINKPTFINSPTNTNTNTASPTNTATGSPTVNGPSSTSTSSPAQTQQQGQQQGQVQQRGQRQRHRQLPPTPPPKQSPTPTPSPTPPPRQKAPCHGHGGQGNQGNQGNQGGQWQNGSAGQQQWGAQPGGNNTQRQVGGNGERQAQMVRSAMRR